MDTIDLEHEQRLTAVEALAKSNMHRIGDLEKNSEALNSLATSVAVIAEKQNNMSEKQDTVVDTVQSIQKEVTTIKEKPAKRWDAIVDKVLLMVVTAVAAYILAKLGL